MTWVSTYNCLKQCLAPSATFCFRLNISPWALRRHGFLTPLLACLPSPNIPVCLCSSSNPKPPSSNHTPGFVLTIAGPGAAWCLHSPSASDTAPWEELGLGQLLNPQMGPDGPRAGTPKNRWATWDKDSRNLQRLIIFWSRLLGGNCPLHEFLEWSPTNGGKKKSSWIPGIENMKSLMRLTVDELTFHPKSII